MDERRVNKYLRQQFAPMGWTLVVYYFLMQTLGTIPVVIALVAQSFSGGEMTEDVMSLAGWGQIASVIVGYIILRLWKKKKFFKEQIWAPGRAMDVSSFMSLLCLVLGTQLANSLFVTFLEALFNSVGLSIMAILDTVSGQADSFSMFLYGSFLAPITEELLFRGFIQRSLMPYGKKFAILCSAFLFGIFHGNLVQTPYAFLVGLVLGYVAAEYSIAWAMVLHMFNNLVLADMMQRLTAGLPAGTGDALTGMIILGGSIAAVVILIVKRQAVRAYLNREWIDKRCLKWFFCNAGVITLCVLMGLQMISLITPLD